MEQSFFHPSQQSRSGHNQRRKFPCSCCACTATFTPAACSAARTRTNHSENPAGTALLQTAVGSGTATSNAPTELQEPHSSAMELGAELCAGTRNIAMTWELICSLLLTVPSSWPAVQGGTLGFGVPPLRNNALLWFCAQPNTQKTAFYTAKKKTN